MLDLKMIRQKPDFVKEQLGNRNVDPADIDALLDEDTARRDLIAKSEQLKSTRNQVSGEISAKKRNKEDASGEIAEMQKVSAEIKE